MKNKEHCFQSIITIPPYQDGIKAVSYTHLDVYKRQEEGGFTKKLKSILLNDR